MFKTDHKFSIITGHYGSGKTNIAINLCHALHKQGKEVTLVDLDIVNPYFRSADFTGELEALGMEVISPTYANTNLDIPALSSHVDSIFMDDGRSVIVDVGGDDDGAIALGRYAPKFIESGDYEFFYVISQYRYLMSDPGESVALLRDIEFATHLKATSIINNSNIGTATTKEDVLRSLAYADEVAKETGLPVAYTTVERGLIDEELEKIPNLLPVDVFVRPVWEENMEG